jgi:hypothetical protein
MPKHGTQLGPRDLIFSLDIERLNAIRRSAQVLMHGEQRLLICRGALPQARQS